MGYFQWKFAILLLLIGTLSTGFAKPSPLDENDYDSVQGDEEDTYDDDDAYAVDEAARIHNEQQHHQGVQNNDISGNPPYFTVHTITKNVSEGEDVTLNCNVNNLQNYNVIMWYNGSQLIATGGAVINKVKVTALDRTTIKISNVDYTDRNQYICSIVPNNINLTIVLNVMQAKSVVIYSHGRDVTERSMTFKQGDRVEFECRVIGSKNAKIIWSLNGERAGNHIENINGGKIIIDSVDSHQAGVYQCLGDDGTENDLPHGSVTINVQYAPKISTHRHYVNTMEHDNAELYCDYKAEPIATIIWHKISSSLSMKEALPVISTKYEIKNKMHKGKNRTHLYIKDIDENDLGEYRCSAWNAIGDAHANIYLIYEPETPQFEDQQIDGNTVTVHWLVRSKQSIAEAAIDYKLNGTHIKWMTESVSRSNLDTHTGVWKLTHTLQLSPGEWIAKMKVKNTFGWSKFSNEHSFVIPSEDSIEDTPPEDIVYAGDIAGKIKSNSNGNNNSNSLSSLTSVPLILAVSLLSLIRIVIQ